MIEKVPVDCDISATGLEVACLQFLRGAGVWPKTLVVPPDTAFIARDIAGRMNLSVAVCHFLHRDAWCISDGLNEIWSPGA